MVFRLDETIEVIGEVSAGDDALRSIAELQPDVVLLDVNIPKINGIQVVSQLKPNRKSPSVIMLTAYDDREQSLHAIRAGAAAYCSKDIEPSRLTEIIKNVAKGQYVVNGEAFSKDGITSWVNDGIEALTNPSVASNDHFVPLSPREMQILRHVTLGNSNLEIAYQLGISHQTVKNHMTSILRKLDVQDRTQAAVYAIAHGWVRVDETLGGNTNDKATDTDSGEK